MLKIDPIRASTKHKELHTCIIALHCAGVYIIASISGLNESINPTCLHTTGPENSPESPVTTNQRGFLKHPIRRSRAFWVALL